MSLYSKEQLILAFSQLGKYLSNSDSAFESIKYSAENNNSWFTLDEINKSVKALAQMLNENDLSQWLEGAKIRTEPKQIGLILAGNIPMVGFHDIISVLASGNKALIKLSSTDQKLIPFVLKKLIEFFPEIENHIQYVEQLKDFDAVIATGNNNSSRYFEYYFGKVPHIIRRNRNSIAILDGTESYEKINALGHDIFDYYGMGCRSVSKIFIPKGYEYKKLFEPLENFKYVINHHKYHNNYDYNKSIYLVNQTTHLDNGFLLLKPDDYLASPLAVVYASEFEDINKLEQELKLQENEIQCIVSNYKLKTLKVFPFGQSQHPQLWDYADNIDTLQFLSEL